MVPIADRLPTTGGPSESDLGPGRPCPADPVRRLVHVTLALYLTPVILVVCLIGGVSVAFGKGTRAARRLAGLPDHRGRDNPFRPSLPVDRLPGPRPPSDWPR